MFLYHINFKDSILPELVDVTLKLSSYSVELYLSNTAKSVGGTVSFLWLSEH